MAVAALLAITGIVGQVLSAAFGGGWHTRQHSPLAVGDFSEPEPDVALARRLVPGSIAIGRSARRRVLFVAHTERGERLRIISARRATRREQDRYEEGIDEAAP